MKRSSAHAVALGWIGGLGLFAALFVLLVGWMSPRGGPGIVLVGLVLGGISLLPTFLAIVTAGIRAALADHAAAVTTAQSAALTEHAAAVHDGQYRVHLPTQQVTRIANQTPTPEAGDRAL